MPSTSGNILSSRRILGAAFLAIAFSNGAAAEEGHVLHYGPNGDDSHWGGECAAGMEQSPIAIDEWHTARSVVRCNRALVINR